MAENHGITAVIYAIAGTDPTPAVRSVLTQTSAVNDVLVIGNLNAVGEESLKQLFPNVLVKRTDSDFISAINSAGLSVLPDSSRWIWVLDSKTVASPTALAELLATASRSPSLNVIAPKLMVADSDGDVLSFGVSMNRFGKTVELAAGAVDQGQLDFQTESLGARLQGCLIDVAHFQGIGGLNEKLGADTGLDLGIRTYLSGYRVGLSPMAKVSRADEGKQPLKVRRSAELRRRFAYAPIWALPFQYLGAILLMLVRILELLLAKKPQLIPGEISGTFAAIFKPAIGYSRSLVAKAKGTGSWRTIKVLREEPNKDGAVRYSDRYRIGFLTGGGIMVLILAVGIGLLMFAPMLGANWLDGGAIARLSDAPDVLAKLVAPWTQFGIEISPAEPFHYLLGMLALMWFPNASLATVWLMILAIPAAAFIAWFAGRTFTRAQIPLGAFALLWAIAPTFLTALNAGRLGAAISHILLPLLLAQLYKANKSWTAAGLSAVLLFFVAAGTPSLGAVLIIVWLILLFIRIKSFAYNFWIPIPTLIAFTPVFLSLQASGNLQLLLQDTGRPSGYIPAPAWQIGLGFPEADLGGLSAIDIPGIATVFITIAVAVLSIPLLYGVIMGMLRGSGAMLFFALALAFVGFVLAVLLPRISLGNFFNEPVAIWNGGMVSLYWFGLLVVFLIGVERMAFLPVFSVVTGITVSGALLLSPLLGLSLIQPNGSQLPAVVQADALSNPETLTLQLSTTSDGKVGVGILRGDGAHLDEYSITLQTNRELDSVDPQIIADLVSGSEIAAEKLYLDGFRWALLINPADEMTPEQEARHNATSSALDSNPAISQIGNLELGRLWQLGAIDLVVDEVPALDVENTANYAWVIWLSISLIISLVIAIPFRGRID